MEASLNITKSCITICTHLMSSAVVARSPSARFSFIGAGVRPTAKELAADKQTPGEGRVKFEVTEKLGDSSNLTLTVR